MPVLWIASSNEKKRTELKRLLGLLGYEIRLQHEAPSPIHTIEDRPDFAGNAELKAVTLAHAVGSPAIADDSGLCVDALDGRPGVHSARYAETDLERIAKLLRELEHVSEGQRTARFVCHVCLVGRAGEVLARFEETCEGLIADTPRGATGFGYDPVFIAAEHRNLPAAPTFAELTPEQKDAVSHRGKALRRLVEFLVHHPLFETDP